MCKQREGMRKKVCVQEGKKQEALWWPMARRVSICECEIGSR